MARTRTPTSTSPSGTAKPAATRRSTRKPSTPRTRRAPAAEPAAPTPAFEPRPIAARTAGELLRVLMIASEASPLAKTGGLGDVLGALPAALARLGHDVTVVIPRYRQVPAGRVVDDFAVTLGGEALHVHVHLLDAAPRVTVAAIDCPPLFDRDGGLYGPGNTAYADNPRRFALLSRAALDWIARVGHRPSVVHAHDWQAGLAPVYLRTMYAGHPVLGRMPTVFTIHNLAYQGICPATWLPALDLPGELMRLDALEYWGNISFLKGGIQLADVITTVSPRYALEIQTPEYGCGFDGILRSRADDLVGILNGIDYEQWNPEADRHLPAPFSAERPEGKAASKRAVLAAMGLPVTETALARPLVGVVSRLADQKGLDLVAAAGDDIAQMDLSLVMLGSGDPQLEAIFDDLAARYPETVAARIGFDDGLAHLIEAGSDLFLMPSRYEPCGLNQMYSLRYGTLPLVRATGGLADTVENYDPATGRGTGFTFADYTPQALVAALRWALDTFRDKDAWRRMQLEGMRLDFSWDRSAAAYVAVYNRAGGGV